MKKHILMLLAFALFFAMASLALAQSTRDGPALASSEELTPAGSIILAAHVPTTTSGQIIMATMDNRANPPIHAFTRSTTVSTTANHSRTTAQEVLSFAQGSNTTTRPFRGFVTG